MKKILLFFLSLAVGIVLFFVVVKTVGWEEVKEALKIFTGWHGLLIILLSFLVVAVGTWRWKAILEDLDVRMPMRRLFGPYLAGFSLMFLIPVLIWGGETLRSYALKREHSISWPKGMASVIIDRILEWSVNLVVILSGGLFFIFKMGLPSKELSIIFGAVFLVLFLFIFFFYFKSARKESIVRFFLFSRKNQPFEVEQEIYSFFRFRKVSAWKALAVSFLRAAIMGFRSWILIIFLGKSIAFMPVLSVLGFTYLAAMIPIPASLGSHEAIQTYAFGALGVGTAAATGFAMIIRTAELIVALFGLVVLFRFGVSLIKNIFFKKLDSLVKNGDNNGI
jgi:uncharacterized protein (TIRG00374 family)